MVSRTHFEYWKNVLISPHCEQFSQNDSEMAFQKNFNLLKYEDIIYCFEAHHLEISNN